MWLARRRAICSIASGQLMPINASEQKINDTPS
jgi:hypothetical protein